jgi:hypothetical protein
MILGERVTVRPVREEQDGKDVARRVRKEDGAVLAETGETVIATSYWLRRLKDGDVEEVATAAEVVAEQLQPIVEKEVVADPKTTKKGQ